jgi:hypothetical protein
MFHWAVGSRVVVEVMGDSAELDWIAKSQKGAWLVIEVLSE